MSRQSAAAMPAIASADDGRDRLASLFDLHQERLYRLARRLTPRADDARDLVQETFLRATKAPGAVPLDTSQEEAWLVRVLINIRQDQWRREAVRRSPLARAHLERSVPMAADPETALVARHTVWRALDLLHPRRRAVVVMHELEGMSPADIASLLGISSVTVRWHLARGRRELARVIGPARGERR